MDNEKKSVKKVFDRALEIESEDDRNAYLDKACDGDNGLRDKVQVLLHAYEEAGSFLDRAAPGLDATTETRRGVERAGQMIDRYKLREPLGEGGFGVVWAAEQTEPVHRKVALKIVKPGMDTRDVIARFEAERQALAMMDHDNIARVLDAGTTEEGRPFFVMELIRGVPITEYCDENKLTVSQRLALFVQVCRAVQHAHQKGIIHRDIKPSNVLVTLHDGLPVPKVIDFGIAKALNQRLTDKTVYTRVHQAIGTLAYMSPEAAELSGLDMDTRADVYGLGVLLYELLTGTTPLDKQRLEMAALHEACRIIREEDPPKASTRLSTLGESATIISAQRRTDHRVLTKEVKGDLDWILLRALEKDRTRRYESASAFATDIQRCLDNEPVEARPPSTIYRLRKIASRHRAAVVTTSVIIFLLVAGIVSSTWFAVRMRQMRDQAIAERQRAEISEIRLRDALNDLHSELRNSCLTAVMSGDEDLALAAIQRADESGLSEDWLEILRGQLALAMGRLDEAIECLKPVAEPNLAAEGMLAMAYLYSGRLEEYAFTVSHLQSREPQSAEDYLFKGQALINVDPKEAVRTIQIALETRNSPLARMILAHAFASDALDTGDATSMRVALREADASRCFIGDTPLMLTTYLFVQHVAIAIGCQPLTDELAAEVQSMVGQMSHVPYGRTQLAWFLEDFEQPYDVDRLWSSASRMSGLEAITYIACLLRSKTPGQILDIIEQRIESPDLYVQCNKAGVMALLPRYHSVARSICEEHLRRPGSYDARSVFLFVLLLMGHPEDAQRWSQELLETSEYPYRYQREAMEYMAGKLDRQQFIDGAAGSCVNESAAFMQVAMVELAQGNREEAEKYFRKCVDTGLFVDGNYWYAKRYLEMMEDDPEWPSWINAMETRESSENAVQSPYSRIATAGKDNTAP